MPMIWALVPYIWVCLIVSGGCKTKHEDPLLSNAGHDKGCDNYAGQLERCDSKGQLEIQSLKTELRNQKQRIDELERLVLKLVTRDDDEENIQQPDDKLASVDRTDDANSVSKAGGTKGQRRRREGSEITAAYYARLTNHVQHAGPNQTVIFDHVITNVGMAYSNTLGAFIAPVPGLYVFSVSLMAYHSESEHYTLSKNKQPIAYLFARAFESPYMNTGHTAILELTKGDNVEIQFRDADGSLHGGYSAFAGFLLQQDYGHGYPVVVGK